MNYSDPADDGPAATDTDNTATRSPRKSARRGTAPDPIAEQDVNQHGSDRQRKRRMERIKREAEEQRVHGSKVRPFVIDNEDSVG